jgi:addiction module HigA family antidote
MRPIHPGEILKDELEEMDMTANSLAGRLDVPANRITSILNERRGITADTALRLARFFGTTPEFWLNLQMTYELRLAQDAKGELILEKIKPVAA